MNIFGFLKNEEIREYIAYSIWHPLGFLRFQENARIEYWKNTITTNDGYERLEGRRFFRPIKFAEFTRVKDEYGKERDLHFRLAGKIVNIDLENVEWDCTFADPEDVAAYHRFMWLYRYVFDVADEYGRNEKDCLLDTVIRIIHSWIDEVETRKKESLHDEVWQTYTVSERVVNWIMTIGMLAQEPIEDEKILTSIIHQAEYIQEHLEYFGEMLTGNHLTNDARAMYIVGTVLGVEKYCNLGRIIIKNEYERLVFNPGFLREGSSHYQLLFTKWYFDLYQIALQFDDIEFAGWLEQKLSNLTICAKFFLYRDSCGQWDMPFFGDISPDHPPKWIMGIPEAIKRIINTEQNNIDFTNEEWGRIEKEGYLIHSRVFANLFPNNAPGHFHRDSGSFTLAFRGKKVIVDSGRKDYSCEGYSTFQKSSNGHNAVIVDGKISEITMRRFYSTKYLKKTIGEKPKIKCDDEAIEIVQKPGRRLKGVSSIKRKIMVDHGEMIIIDSVEGEGIHEVEFPLHIHPDFKLKKYGEEICAESDNVHINISCSLDSAYISCVEDDKKICSYSEEYGDDRVCKVILFKKKTELPFTIETRIKAEEIL